MNKHSVKFIRGSKTIWDQLNTTPEKIDNNALYFIYEDENYSVGKLYLGQRLITDDKIINIKDIGDIQIDDESLIDKQILIYNEENQKWKNSSLEEIIDLSNYYTKDEIDNVYHKTITSTNRPPSGAPVEVDVDLLRVGDTWILSGYNIVYKLVKAQYNYQPTPDAEPYHQFIWQPLNERYDVGNTEPPTSVTYQPVIYTINEVQWSWLPVPEYFKDDHYQMLIGLDDPTYYICVSGNMADTGACNYRWREEGGSIDAYTKAETNALLADKMDLAPLSPEPLSPTDEQIAALRQGQVFATNFSKFYDTIGVKTAAAGTAGDRQAYTKTASDLRYGVIYRSNSEPLRYVSLDDSEFNEGDIWIKISDSLGSFSAYICEEKSFSNYLNRSQYIWVKLDKYLMTQTRLVYTETVKEASHFGRTGIPRGKYEYGDVVKIQERNASTFSVYSCREVSYQFIGGGQWQVSYQWEIISSDLYSNYYTSSYINGNYYTKTEIDSMIPTVPTNISAFTNDSGYLTLGTLPIYDGTVI